MDGHILQRFVRPKSVKGERAYFITSQMRKLIKKDALPPQYQFLAIQILLYLEGMVDRLPKIYMSFHRGEMADGQAAVESTEVMQGLASLADSLNTESDKGTVRPRETEPSMNHGDDKYADIIRRSST